MSNPFKPTTDTGVATLRTTWNAAVIAAFVWVANWIANRYGYAVDVSSPWFIAGATAVAGVGYRLSVAISEWAASRPWVGHVLFGKPKPPTYQ